MCIRDRYHSDYKLVKGQHEALIDEDVFNLSVLMTNTYKHPVSLIISLKSN